MDNVTSAVILAGGKSIRMGFDKQFLKVNETYLINIIVGKLKDYFDEVIIISNSPELEDIILDKDVSIYEDDVKDFGPLGGIYTALNKASSDMVYITACDMPNVNGEYVEYLKSRLIDDSDGLITKYQEWIEPMNAYYSKSNMKAIMDYLDSGKKNIYGFAKTRNFCYIEEKIARTFSPNWEMFDNLNSIEDLDNHNLMQSICVF